MKRRKKILKIWAVLLCISAIVLVLLAINRWEQQENTFNTSEYKDDNGRNAETVLIMGLDKHNPEESAAENQNNQQPDFIMLLILNPEKDTCDFLHFNRNTMTEISRPGGSGSEDTELRQLALAYTFGSGGSDSCINVKHAVSGLLEGAPVDHYVTFTMDAAGILNDLAGGVELKINDDLSKLDPSLIKGETVTLTGDQAVNYIKYRPEPDENLMKRQQQYMEALLSRICSKAEENPDFLIKAGAKLNSSVQSDLSISQLGSFLGKLDSCARGPVIMIPGETAEKSGTAEFYPDKEALHKIISDLFGS